MQVLDLFKLTNKVAVITGAAGYLGGDFGEAFAEAGAHVVLADLNGKLCEERANILSGIGSESMGFCVDVTDTSSIESMVKKVEKRFQKIDILVNAACQHISTSLEERTPADFERILRVDLTGTFLCSQIVGRRMIEQRHGNIINLGSIYGIVSSDPRIYGSSGLNNPEVYSASKGGIIQLTKYLAVHLAKYNIRVNCLSPGGVYNNQDQEFLRNYNNKVPMARMARPEELKGALVYLASEASSYVTGHNLVVDGGLTIW